MTVVRIEKPRRRKGWIVVVALLGVLALLACGLVAAELWARQQVTDYATTTVRDVLELDAEHPVDVTVAGFSVLAQLATGKLERVDIGVDDVNVGDFSGDVSLLAEGVPVDMSKPVDRVRLELAVTEASVKSLAHVLSESAIDNVELVGDEVRFTSELSIFGFRVDVGVGVEPFATNGQVGFTPTSVSLNGAEAEVSALRATFGPLADSLFESRTVCVARYLPAALGIDSVEVRDDAFLVVTIGSDDRVLNEAALQKRGWCPSGGAR